MNDIDKKADTSKNIHRENQTGGSNDALYKEGEYKQHDIVIKQDPTINDMNMVDNEMNDKNDKNARHPENKNQMGRTDKSIESKKSLDKSTVTIKKSFLGGCMTKTKRGFKAMTSICGKEKKDVMHIKVKETAEVDDHVMIVGLEGNKDPRNLRVEYLNEVYTTRGFIKRLSKEIEEVNRKYQNDLSNSVNQNQEDDSDEELEMNPEHKKDGHAKEKHIENKKPKKNEDEKDNRFSNDKMQAELNLKDFVQLEMERKESNRQVMEMFGKPDIDMSAIQNKLENNQFIKAYGKGDQKSELLDHTKHSNHKYLRKGSERLDKKKDRISGLTEIKETILGEDFLFKFEISLYGKSWT